MTQSDYQIYTTRKLLDAEHCRALIETVEREATWFPYSTGPAGGLQVRQDIYDLNEVAFAGLYKRALAAANAVNAAYWKFELDGWRQPLRVARYRPGYRHDWHVDYTAEDTSKLAMSVPLNDEYEGGDLELLEVPGVEAAPPGTAVFFAGFHGHRVTEVTAGTRYVLLGWLTGPRFR